MERMVFVLPMLVMFFMFITLSDAVRCYMCISEPSSDCGEPFTLSRAVKTCTGKSCLTTLYGSQDQMFVERSCYVSIPAGQFGCHDTPGAPWRNLQALRQCYCNTDYCNGRGSLKQDPNQYPMLPPMNAAPPDHVTTTPKWRITTSVAAMTSSAGHVVIVVALLINLFIAYLL